MLQEKLLRAYSIEINQAAVLLSLDLTTGGNVKQNYTNNALWGAQKKRDNNDPLEINFFSSLKSNFNYKKGIIEWN